MPWPTFKLVEAKLADDGNTVGPVQADSADVEHSRDGCVAAKTDQVDQDAQQ